MYVCICVCVCVCVWERERQREGDFLFIRLTKVLTLDNVQYWGSCEEMELFMHCWSTFKLTQAFWRFVKLNTHWPFDPPSDWVRIYRTWTGIFIYHRTTGSWRLLVVHFQGDGLVCSREGKQGVPCVSQQKSTPCILNGKKDGCCNSIKRGWYLWCRSFM